MTGIGDAALNAAVLKTLADEVETALTAAKQSVMGGLAGSGTDRAVAVLPDGTKVASLPLAGGETKARVADPGALLAWMEANRPGEIVKTVRPDTVKAILAAANKEGRAVDTATGQVIPGIEFAPTTPYVSVTFSRGRSPGEGGRDVIKRAWQAGELDLRDMLLALPEGGGLE